jgi:mannose-6-phosphate isomerase-like protein (cupin superfamily)
MQNESCRPIVVPPGHGSAWQVLGETITRKVASAETGGTYAIVEEVTPPQSGPPLHCHQHEDEVFYVLEGELDVQCGNHHFTATPGTLAVLPRSIPHTFRNRSPRPSRVVVLILPGGFEQFFAEVHALSTAGPPSMEDVTNLAAQHGVALVGPPLGT